MIEQKGNIFVMALDYNEDKHSKVLLSILDDHSEWFHHLVQGLFYPEGGDALANIIKPTSFAEWSVYVISDDSIQPEIIDKLNALHHDLFVLSDMLVNKSIETQAIPCKDDFDKFITIYEEFFLFIRRLEKDSILEGSGYDLLTGLRNKKFFIPDIERELQRMARKGRSFCVALARIDNFALIKEHTEKNEAEGYIKLVSSLIKLSIRSFDDAYYLGNDEFALCLKQSEVSGGISALDRLRHELENQGVILSLGDMERPLSMSCCIVEPIRDHDVKELIENLRLDLKDSNCDKTDTVLEYHELSQLERYIQNGR